ncbi:MAG TPA: PEP-CTERM sorting domain-containing protein [Gammaproteobacteria bacterium]|nr:PEP-CTERM sorting domain-containing protein [Gammaproteobacteria bacterium]
MMRSYVEMAAIGIAALIGAGVSHTAHAVTITHTFDTLDPLTVAQSGILSPGFLDQDFEITNNTGETWTDFHMRIDSGNAQTVAFAANPGPAYVGPGTGTVGDSSPGNLNDFLDIVGLSIADNSALSFTVRLLVGEEAFDVDLLAEPSTPTHFGTLSTGGGDGIPSQVPEPTGLALLGAGLAGLSLVRARRRIIRSTRLPGQCPHEAA